MASQTTQHPQSQTPLPPVSINELLRTLRPSSVTAPEANADDIAFAISNVFTNTLTPVQTALLLYTLSLTGLEQRPDILAKCATAMRAASVTLDAKELSNAISSKRRRIGSYQGGLCDIVGTGGDFHSTFNISTTSSILCSSLLLIAKHGNRASTSKSGSADVLACMRLDVSKSRDDSKQISPRLEAVTPNLLNQIYPQTNYAFLFAPNFHTGLRHISSLRKEMPCPTIFNLLGPLTNPAESCLEARVIGVKRKDLVDVFAGALRLNGTRKGMVVCGMEDLDEVSCAGETICARLVVREGSRAAPGEGQGNADEAIGVEDVEIQRFTLAPEDFGLPRHPLESVSPGMTADENAKILSRLLEGELEEDNPIQQFVFLNAATLFVVSGVCDAESCPFGSGEDVNTELGPGGGRWKEGVRLAKLAIRSGRALEMLNIFARITNETREAR